MSPLRGWMQEHGRPSWYSWVVVVLVPLMASIGVLVISLRVNERAVQRETQARLASERALCGIVVLLDNANRKSEPPVTGYGRELAEAIRGAREAYGCPPFG